MNDYVVQSILMKTNKKTYVIEYISGMLLAAVLAGCGAGQAATPQTEADLMEAVGEEQASLMAEYDLMEAQDNAVATTDGQNAEDMGDTGAQPSGDKAGETAVNDPDSTEIIMVGDILLHTPVEEEAYDPDTDKYNYDFIFEDTRSDIEQADIAIVNQEVIIGGKELGVSGYPSFNAPNEIGDALVDAGFDVVCQATNHAMDKGAKGITNCVNYWQEQHPEILMVGIRDKEDDLIATYEDKQTGIKVAILNYTYGTNGIPLPADKPYAVSLLKEDKVTEDLIRAEQEADFTIVIPHWGTEYSMGVSAEQRKWAKIFAGNGADLILGAHPHVIEPIEWVGDDNADGAAYGDPQATDATQGANNGALCYYSVGNFVNWTSGTGKGVVNRMIGGMAKVSLKKADDGRVYISHYAIEPIVCHVESGRENVRVYKLDDYNEQLGQQSEIIKQDPEFSYGYCAALTEEMWGEAIEGVDVAP